MAWQVFFTKQANKQFAKLPQHIVDAVHTLIREIEELGPVRHNWKNFSKLKGKDSSYHCHLKAGKPTYVSCWYIEDKKLQIVEVYYVGTHEKAPY